MKKSFYSKFIDPKKIKYIYPLLEKGLTKMDLQKGINVLKSGFITMGNETEIFEKEFAKKIK